MSFFTSFPKNQNFSLSESQSWSMWTGTTGGDFEASDRSLFYTLLSNVTNGNKILEKKLDSCVSTAHNNEDASDYALKVDLEPLLGGKKHESTRSMRQVHMIKDMLDFKNNSAAKYLLLHPVIQTFLELKWRRIKFIFIINFIIYLLFLMTYSLYLSNYYYRPLGHFKNQNVLWDKNCRR